MYAKNTKKAPTIEMLFLIIEAFVVMYKKDTLAFSILW